MQQPVGYQFIIEALGLDLPPLLRPGCIERVRTVQETETDLHQAPVLYPEAMWPGDRLFDHLRFALEHEGVQPGVLKAFGNRTDLPRLILDDAAQFVRPLHRRLAFVHTFLTGEIVPLAVAKEQRYIDVANPRLQFVLDKGDLDPAYRLRNNLLGTCPLWRGRDPWLFGQSGSGGTIRPGFAGCAAGPGPGCRERPLLGRLNRSP